MGRGCAPAGRATIGGQSVRGRHGGRRAPSSRASGGWEGRQTRSPCTVLGFVDASGPVVGAPGVVSFMRAGVVHIDVGYRYKRVLKNSLVGSILGGGRDLQINQLRFGLGVRF